MDSKEVYRTKADWQADGKADTLVIHCSTHNFRIFFTEFLTQHLKLAAYDLLAVPGGIQVLTLIHFMPKVASMARKWVEFLVEKHGIKRIVIIGHEDCAWYRDFRFGPIHINLKDRQLKDMLAVGADLRRLGTAVDIYFARPEGGRVAFTKID